MQRRDFLALGTAGVLGALGLRRRSIGAEPASLAPAGIQWQRSGQTSLFRQVLYDGQPLVRGNGAGLLDGFCRLSQGTDGAETVLTPAGPSGACGPVRISLTHRLLASRGGSQHDLLEASLVLHNTSDRSQAVEAGFASAARPTQRAVDQQVYLPISAGGLQPELRLAELGSRQWLQDCCQPVGPDGLRCHYLEPSASDPHHTTTRALLLAPVVDIFSPQADCRVAFFTTSLEASSFEAVARAGEEAWRMGRRLRLEPASRCTLRGYLYVHRNDAAEAWAAFQRFGHHEDFPAVDWLREIRVHYFDFLSAAAPGGRRGDGFDADLPHFRDFRVGMATQHGYYPEYGDYVHPDRKQWRAMVSDPAGAVSMSLEKIKARVEATRRAGAHPAVYLHMLLLDEGSPLYERLKDSVVVNAEGRRTDFDWHGPDVAKRSWKMSVASPEWRDHLLQQTRWIMELFDPDAVVVDETFTALGYDHHPRREGPLAPHGIELMRKMRALLRSFGPQKALLTSDCSMSNLVMWADGEAGDHAYAGLLGSPLYRQRPVRFLAALGNKPWRPCAWNFQRFWAQQVELARAVGAGVGVSNGWAEFTGLARLPAAVQERMIRDIKSL